MICRSEVGGIGVGGCEMLAGILMVSLALSEMASLLGG